MAYTFKHGDRPIDGYTIQRAVGKGGFGEVYYAISDGGREVALKYLRDNPQVELRGVSHCINLKSPHLVSIFDVKKTTDGEYVLIMEYCSGPSLRDLLLAEPNGFAPQKAAFFVREIAKGLAYLHDRGIVHRDLKPGNLFYDDGYVKIGDYGLSKFISVSRHSGQTASVGTVHYMAPEIGSGNYSRGVDIYALGVILYEMLLGKVPFEGSTMAEVLMKHLTAQPEIESLPQPFGVVIRKALQKDPNDRFQTVDEMVEAILDVDEIRESVAGFHPQSLDAAVRARGGSPYDSPMPSPNPMLHDAQQAGPPGQRPGAPPFAQPLNPNVRLPDRLAKRMDRVSKRMNARLAKLAAKHPHRAPFNAPPPHAPFPQATPPQNRADRGAPVGADLLSSNDRRKRIALTTFLSIALAIALGILIGNTQGADAGASAGMLVAAMTASVLLARRAHAWFGIETGPKWTKRLVGLCYAAPLLAIGAAPIMDGRGEEGVAVYLGLLLSAVFFDTSERGSRRSARCNGEISFAKAIWTAMVTAFFTMIAGAMLNCDPEEYILISMGVSGVVSLVIQAASWLPQRSSESKVRQPVSADKVAAPAVPANSDAVATPESPQAAPWDAPNQALHARSNHGHARHPLARWTITRAFWGLVAFALMGGAIVTFLIPLVAEDFDYHSITGAIIGCVACVSFMIFALRKTTPLKRPGFWRETLRPFLISLTMSGIGATIVGIAREWHHTDTCWNNEIARCIPDEGRVALLAGLIVCSILFVALTLFTGKRQAPPQPFLRNMEDGSPLRATHNEQGPQEASEFA